MVWYHGSANDFDKFKLPEASEHGAGTDMGFGLYFTDSVYRAQIYAEQGNVYEIELEDSGMGISNSGVTLSQDKVSEIVKKFAEKEIEEDGYPYSLSDWGEATEEWSEVNDDLSKYIASRMIDATDDVAIINSIYQQMGGDQGMAKEILPGVLTEVGITHSIREFDFEGQPSLEMVVFDPQNIEIVGKRELKNEVEISNDKGEIIKMDELLANKIETQWRDWTNKHGLYDQNTSFFIGDDGEMELLVDALNHTTLPINRSDGEFFKLEDIVDDHNNLNEAVIAESVINAVNNFDPDEEFNELWSPEYGEYNKFKPSEFIKMLTDDKEYYEEKAQELNDEYGLSIDITGPSMNI